MHYYWMGIEFLENIIFNRILQSSVAPVHQQDNPPVVFGELASKNKHLVVVVATTTAITMTTTTPHQHQRTS